MRLLLAAVLILSGCESSRQFGSMLWAQPACVLICLTTQTIVADNTALTGTRDSESLSVSAVDTALEETVVAK